MVLPMITETMLANSAPPDSDDIAMPTATFAVDSARYARCIEASRRIRWEIDRDVFKGREFDLAHKFLPHDRGETASSVEALPDDLEAFEQQKVKGAIRTDFILSAEIIVISLGTLAGRTFVEQVLTLLATAGFFFGSFALVPLLWTRIVYPDRLPQALIARIDAAILEFRYWMDEPGNDVQWYFSENHALLFHTSAYLAGNLLPDARFRRADRAGRRARRQGVREQAKAGGPRPRHPRQMAPLLRAKGGLDHSNDGFGRLCRGLQIIALGVQEGGKVGHGAEPGQVRGHRGIVLARQPLEHGRGAQVGEEAHFLAQAQDRLFRAQMPLERVAIGIANAELKTTALRTSVPRRTK